ncbi:hypothetical protein C8F04DRAFT_471788 [Mycena alexandri]|uniref:Apple domain-containing protein n=1 Tax=Mycena alexandri TaxID=1745969 RepID=A0AAD6SZG2_9AGAR|nr:hypothetical protein C8F04DRAFT_471788 [Mycena alexandri]
MAIRTLLATLCILSCALLVAPSAYIDKKGALARREGYDQGGGYGYHNGGYDTHGGYDHNGGHAANGGHNHPGHGGHQGHHNASDVILGFDDPERFCADYLGFSELYATTQTVTETDSPTITETSSETTDIGTSTFQTTLEGTVKVTITVATTTDPGIATSTETDYTSTSTVYQYTAGPPQQPAGRRRAHAAARKRMQAVVHKRDLPPPLQRFNESEISAACSDIAMPQTTYQTSTTTAEQTATATTTTQIPATTTTTTTTLATTTLFPSDTETDYAATLTATTTAPGTPTTTVCAQSQPVSDIITGTDGGTIGAGTTVTSAEECCQLCFAPLSGCGVWKYAAIDNSCELGTGAVDPSSTAPPTGQCPHYGRYTLVAGVSFVGGQGPCSAGQYPVVVAGR